VRLAQNIDGHPMKIEPVPSNGSPTSPLQPVLICGLGRLGQHCAVLLKELGIPVFGLTDIPLIPEVEAMPNLFGRLTVGDCRATPHSKPLASILAALSCSPPATNE
jgi:hypothetical protein